MNPRNLVTGNVVSFRKLRASVLVRLLTNTQVRRYWTSPEDGEQRVYSATGTPLGIMKTAEQFEKPMSERFALGDFGKTDLGADAFDLDVMALQDEPDDADREFAELSPKSFARSADHVMPPLLAEYSDDDDCESDDGGDDCGGSDWSNGYSLSPPCVPQPKSATTCNGESQISENAKPKSLLVGILHVISSKLQGWAQPSQMLSPRLDQSTVRLPTAVPPSVAADSPRLHEVRGRSLCQETVHGAVLVRVRRLGVARRLLLPLPHVQPRPALPALLTDAGTRA